MRMRTFLILSTLLFCALVGIVEGFSAADGFNGWALAWAACFFGVGFVVLVMLANVRTAEELTPRTCPECHQEFPAHRMVTMHQTATQICSPCWRAKLWPDKFSRTLGIALCWAALATDAGAWGFIDWRGSNVTTAGQRTIIIIGQLDCAAMPRQITELAAVKAAHPGLDVVALLPCTTPEPERVRAFVRSVPGAGSVTVCEVPISHPILELWAAQGYRQPFGTYWDASGWCSSTWTNYQSREKFTTRMAIGRDLRPRYTASFLPWQLRTTITNGVGMFSLALP